MFRSIAELPPELTVSINHIARVSVPFISPLTLLQLYLPALFISLFLWKIALCCFSAAHPLACRRAAWARVILQVGGRSIHLRSTELLTADSKKIKRSTSKGRGNEEAQEKKGPRFSPPLAFLCLRGLSSRSCHPWLLWTLFVSLEINLCILVTDVWTHGLQMKHISTNNHLSSP